MTASSLLHRKLGASEPKLPAGKPRGKAAKLSQSQKGDRHDMVEKSAAASPPPPPTQQLYHRDVHHIKHEPDSPEPLHSRHEPPLSHSHSHHSHRQPAGQASPVLRPVRSTTRDHDLREPEEPAMEDLPYMTTTEMYLCCWKQPPLSPLRESSPCKEEDVDSEWIATVCVPF